MYAGNPVNEGSLFVSLESQNPLEMKYRPFYTQSWHNNLSAVAVIVQHRTLTSLALTLFRLLFQSRPCRGEARAEGILETLWRGPLLPTEIEAY